MSDVPINIAFILIGVLSIASVRFGWGQIWGLPWGIHIENLIGRGGAAIFYGLFGLFLMVAALSDLIGDLTDSLLFDSYVCGCPAAVFIAVVIFCMPRKNTNRI